MARCITSSLGLGSRQQTKRQSLASTRIPGQIALKNNALFSLSYVNKQKRRESLERVGVQSAQNVKSLVLSTSRPRAESDILEAISQVKGRGKSGMSIEDQKKLEMAVEELESSGSGVRDPTRSELLEGRWVLLYTSRPTTASSIQRSFTGVDGFSVFQEIELSDGQVRVNNIVDFGANTGFLRVEAVASTDQVPLDGFVPRKGKGLPFGILGTSSTDPPTKKNIRVDFQFDSAAFYLKPIPISIPYPVPFRLLGDERKGWIDVTYLSKDGKFRLSRGNKGTLFILAKEDGPKEKLIASTTGKAPVKNKESGNNNNLPSARDNDAVIESLVDEVLRTESFGKVRSPAYSPLATGGWKLVWTKQGSTANALQQKLTKVVQNWQIISSDGSVLQNRVDLLPGVQIIAEASAKPASPTRTNVVISRVIFALGPLLKFTLPVETDSDGFIDWLYLDSKLRITKGNKGSIFVHIRDRSVE
eukprot:jgi/Picsp_1/5351/NSC_02712-R1_plastid lipid associated protein